MTPEREKLIRDVWAGVRGWPVNGPILNVAIRRPLRLKPMLQGETVAIEPRSDRYLSFERGVEYSEDGLWERFYVECEGLRVLEQIAPMGKARR